MTKLLHPIKAEQIFRMIEMDDREKNESKMCRKKQWKAIRMEGIASEFRFGICRTFKMQSYKIIHSNDCHTHESKKRTRKSEAYSLLFEHATSFRLNSQSSNRFHIIFATWRCIVKMKKSQMLKLHRTDFKAFAHRKLHTTIERSWVSSIFKRLNVNIFETHLNSRCRHNFKDPVDF